MLTRYCIRLNIDKNKPETMLGLEDRIERFKPTRFYLLSPDGEVLEEMIPADRRSDVGRVCALIEGWACRLRLQPGSLPVADAVCATPPGGTVLRVTSRFISEREQPPPPGRVYRYPAYPTPALPTIPSLQSSLSLRGGVPASVLVPWTAQQCAQLLPPEAQRGVGSTYELAPTLAAALLCQLRPPTHYNAPSAEDVLAVRCQGRVVAASAGEVQVALSGTVDGYNPWFPTPRQIGPRDFVPHHALCQLAGYMQVSLPEGRLQRLAIATVWGLYMGSDQTLMPYVSVLESTDSPAQR